MDALYSNEIDVITKLLHEDALNRERKFSKTAKSLYEELKEVEENLQTKSNHEINPQRENNIKTQSDKSKENFLKSKLHEFRKLSQVMDDEIKLRQRKTKEDRRTIEKVHTVLSFAELEKKRMLDIIKNYKQDVQSMQITVKEKEDNLKELTKSFNDSLNEREKEIDNLMSQNTDLQLKINNMEVCNTDINEQNDDLEEEIVIKDEFICSLKLQINNLEKQHQQDLWKLSQSEDLLEMIETERENDERKLKGKIMFLQNQFRNIQPMVSVNARSRSSNSSTSLSDVKRSNYHETNGFRTCEGDSQVVQPKTERQLKYSLSIANDNLFKSLGWKNLRDVKK